MVENTVHFIVVWIFDAVAFLAEGQIIRICVVFFVVDFYTNAGSEYLPRFESISDGLKSIIFLEFIALF